MNDATERAVARALDPYAQALRGLERSPALDSRMDAAIAAWAQQSTGRRLLRRPLPWLVAAASVAVITGGIALLVSRDAKRPEVESAVPMVSEARVARMSPLAAGQMSLYPAESAIFRVKASFASTVSVPETGEVAGERQYWVDVRIASDGTMRIVQVLPADRGRVEPRQ